MKVKRILFFVFLISLFAKCLYAQEKGDMSLFEIDRLIRKTEYDEALRQLNTYIELHPDNFDNAQIRVGRIMKARQEYSILAQRLIELIRTDPGNDKEIYEITDRLEKFEKNPSDQNLRFVADLKKSAEFNYFRAQFLEIQNATAENTKNKKYIEAIDKATEGFWLYKDRFFEKWENDLEITNKAIQLSDDLNNYILMYKDKNFIPKINNAVDDFIKAVNQDSYDLALTRFENVKESFVRYNNLRSLVIANGNNMQSLFITTQEKDSEFSDASYLPFMFRFVFGIDAVPNSGILGAIDGYWNEIAGKMNNAVFMALNKQYKTYTIGITQKYVDNIERYVLLENKVLDLYKIADTENERKINNPYSQYYVIGEYIQNISNEIVTQNKINNDVQNIAKDQKYILEKIQSNISEKEKSDFVFQLFSSNAQVGKLVGVKENKVLSNFEWVEKYNQLSRTDWSEITEVYNTNLENIFEKSSTLLNSAWNEITQYYKEKSNQLCIDIQNDNKVAVSYVDGFITEIDNENIQKINTNIENAIVYLDSYKINPNLDFGIKYSYPNISLDLSKYTQKQIDNYINEIQDYKNIIHTSYDSYEQWKTEIEINNLVTETTQYLTEQQDNLRNLNNIALQNMEIAQDKINLAQLAKNEAEIRFSEAENALRREDFDLSRRKLQDALTKYEESLNNQNDNSLRSTIDTKLQNLGERIAKTENEIVVREVRNLKTQAKDAYFNGRFDDAEKLLNQAKIRWAVTNVNEDEEIVNLLNFVNTAISMKTGRDISPSAPQYPEMSQLMNIAYQYFDEGSRKIGDGNNADGIKDLDIALENVQKVQYVYPLNQEASLLTLRINRLKDPDKFKSEFAQKIDMAKMMVRNNSQRQEGYLNLLDYYELEPNYKGLKELIYQTEIDIGIRQKPIDNSGERRVQRLIADAQKLYNNAGNDVAKLTQALEKIDEALVIVSDNKTATDLKDRITIKIGGNASAVISTADERSFQIAIQRLQDNNVVGASVIVEQLMKNPINANSQKIKDLKKKIDARL